MALRNRVFLAKGAGFATLPDIKGSALADTATGMVAGAPRVACMLLARGNARTSNLHHSLLMVAPSWSHDAELASR